ncbi:MAG: bifunctional phosphopantothenoylcysteine decarboxylase/phosphopantothenate--cysteine ligase CoaBC [Gammaproteobacteria bacterium]|nr:bifunctional phosphopantothenoylcysteine decarboxylase/phosphopantothenate--cysteine ligase CoaBC [Gammaproteobacteria bacterium]
MQITLKKKIVLGVTGGIAAYKAAELLRLLIKAGAEVRVVMTPAACEFVQPLTFQALSGHRVYTDIFDGEAESAMDHIELARWADLMVVAPASADFIAKMRQGYGDNLLLTLCLAEKKSIAIAPAMNQQMYANLATQENLKVLAERGTLIWGPNAGEQACGDVGLGRMLEAEAVLRLINIHFQPGKLTGKRVLITAGPTRESIDPVRYISNHSSGKMGYALAQAARQAGADVTLVSGPVNLAAPPGVQRISVESAVEMFDAVMGYVDVSDIFIACAAVADYRVAQQSQQKIKKTSDQMVLSLTPNPDIVSAVTGVDEPPFTLGFAAETENLEQYAADKLSRKKLDMIAANRVGNSETGFGTDSNEILLLWAGGKQLLPLAGKPEIARQLIDILADRYAEIN